MHIFYLTSFTGSVKEIISTSLEAAIGASGWSADDIVVVDQQPITAWPIAHHNAPGMVRAESKCAAW